MTSPEVSLLADSSPRPAITSSLFTTHLIPPSPTLIPSSLFLVPGLRFLHAAATTVVLSSSSLLSCLLFFAEHGARPFVGPCLHQKGSFGRTDLVFV